MKTDAAPWDLAVVGAGPAGSVCACSALATSDRMRVALIDRERFPRDKPCGDAVRSDAMSELRELGLGAIFDGKPLITDIHQTDQDAKSAYLVKLLSSKDEFAFSVVERTLFDHHLFKEAQERGAQAFTGYELRSAEFDDGAGLWTLDLQAEDSAVVRVRCRVLVGADGAGSRVRRLAGLRRNGEAHTAVALRAYATVEGLPGGTLRFDSFDNMISGYGWEFPSMIPGYGWLFPLAAGKVNIGLGMRRPEFKRSGIGLESHLEEYVRYLSSQGVVIRNLGDIKAHPLPMASQTPPLVPKRRMALVGDAASMTDPLFGEGIHYGVWAARRLGRVVGECVNRGGGDLEAGLESYARAYAEQFDETMKQHQSARDLILFRKYFFG